MSVIQLNLSLSMSEVADQGSDSLEKQPSQTEEVEDAKSVTSTRKSTGGSKQASRQGSAQSLKSAKSSSTKVSSW